jgi:hypothetical protein
MQAWTAPELGRFLGWADARDAGLAMGWRPPGCAAVRHWPSAGETSIWRPVGSQYAAASVVKAKGAGEQLVEGPTKTGQSRVVDLDSGTVGALRAYRAARALLALDLVRDSAIVLSNLDGSHRHPERFSRRSVGQSPGSASRARPSSADEPGEGRAGLRSRAENERPDGRLLLRPTTVLSAETMRL